MLFSIMCAAYVQVLDAQFAIGAFGGKGTDQAWAANMSHLGLLGEFRTAVLPTTVARLSVTYHLPVVDQYVEYAPSQSAGMEGNLLSETTGRKSILVTALDLKWPFQNDACTDGYYKGAYFFAGVGWALRSHIIDAWKHDQAGVVTTSHSDYLNNQLSLRFGFGGEWNFRWGSPFVEGLITASTSPEARDQTFLFPGTLSVSIGYRFSFAHPEPESEEEL